jgi:glycosyltransferase involved in cell wall biosynthesis
VSIKVAILTRPDFRSPRILAEALKHQVAEAGSEAKVFYDIEVLGRLNSYSETGRVSKFHFWLRKKIVNYFKDKRLIRDLKRFDAVVISECCPNGFWKRLYNVEKLKKILKVPVLFYEVYYLGNAPSQIKKLQQANEPLIERYDWHLAVSATTEIRGTPGKGWSCIGLDLSFSGLKPIAKNKFIALVDFVQPGFEKYREEQLSVLSELGIEVVVLEGSYSLNEIRQLYKKACIFFIQTFEAFGLPIAECLACGVQIFTASSAWPMSWRLDANPQVHSESNLPEIFTVYNSREDLKNKIIQTKKDYVLSETPFKVFNSFIQHYPHFYYGNVREVKDVLQRIEQRRFN